MEHAQKNSYDKAMNSLDDAKLRWGQALSYLNKGAWEVVYIAVWLAGILALTKAFDSNQKDLTPHLPDKTKQLVNLFEIIQPSKSNSVLATVLTAGLYASVKDPENGKKIVEQAFYTIENCAIGTLHLVKAGYHCTWHLAKAGYHFAHHYLGCESQIDESSSLGGEAAEVTESQTT